MGLAEQATRILSEPVAAGVLVEPRGTAPALSGAGERGDEAVEKGRQRREGRGNEGGPMFLAATAGEFVLLAVGRGLLARRLSGVVVARVAREAVSAIELEDRGVTARTRGAVDLTLRMLDGDSWSLSVAAGQHASAAEVASLAS